MLYADVDIERAIRRGDIAIEGMVDGSLQPASVDFHLSDQPFKVFLDRKYPEFDVDKPLVPIVPWVDQGYQYTDMPLIDDGSHEPYFMLAPGQFALASTVERVKIGHHCAGRLEGKSSLARLGLLIHTTAGFFDPGFQGYCTLELVNLAPQPLLLRPGMPIGQMSFFETISKVRDPYSGKYQNQGEAPEPSHYDKNFEDQTA